MINHLVLHRFCMAKYIMSIATQFIKVNSTIIIRTWSILGMKFSSSTLSRRKLIKNWQTGMRNSFLEKVPHNSDLNNKDEINHEHFNNKAFRFSL